MIRSVIFELDGTLVVDEPMSSVAMSRVSRRAA